MQTCNLGWYSLDHKFALKKFTYLIWFLNLAWFDFFIPVNSYGHVETVSSPNHTFPGLN